jgi:hypothetical protein
VRRIHKTWINEVASAVGKKWQVWSRHFLTRDVLHPALF